MINISFRRHRFSNRSDRRWINNFLIGLIVSLSIVWVFTGSSFATPTLQLDIAGGTYDMSTETIVASTDPFAL